MSNTDVFHFISSIFVIICMYFKCKLFLACTGVMISALITAAHELELQILISKHLLKFLNDKRLVNARACEISFYCVGV